VSICQSVNKHARKDADNLACRVHGARLAGVSVWDFSSPRDARKNLPRNVPGIHVDEIQGCRLGKVSQGLDLLS